jgi:hypothetical protein
MTSRVRVSRLNILSKSKPFGFTAFNAPDIHDIEDNHFEWNYTECEGETKNEYRKKRIDFVVFANQFLINFYE